MNARSSPRPDFLDRRDILKFALFALPGLLETSAGGAEEQKASFTKTRRLIEFGWDEPDTTFLRRHLIKMEKTPFDGCVFHVEADLPGGKLENFAWKFWGRRSFAPEELVRALEDLKGVEPQRFHSNFLRVNTTPADLDWFDDFGPILANARLAGKLARAGRSAGILFDTEQYQGPLFDYSKQSHAETRSWDDYAAQARLRGREVMEAFQEGFPDLIVLLTFGPSLVVRQRDVGKRPASEVADGLLVPFVEGMTDAIRGRSSIVDGHEPSYGYRDPKRFDEALATIRAAVPKVEAGFGLWLDYNWPEKGWDVNDPSNNYFTPEVFESSVRAALERTDGIVWIYTETPRWWTEHGPSAKLPAPYVDAIRRARRGLTRD